MIQHDMMMWDHGMPRADGTWNPEQRPEADVNIEFQSTAKRADEAMKLAFFFREANERCRHRLPGRGGSAHDQHRLDARSWTSSRRSACARTSGACTPARGGTRRGISRSTSSRRSRTRIFDWD